MIVSQDIDKDAKGRDKYGFKATFTAEAIETILRQVGDMPEGEMVRMEVDQERLLVSFYFRSEKPCQNEFGELRQPCPGRVGQAGEYPERWEIKK